MTLAANTADFERIGFRPRVLRDVATRDLSTDFLGGHHALPLMLGPVGSLGLFRAGAETAAFRAAAAGPRRRQRRRAPSWERRPPFSSDHPRTAAGPWPILDRIAAMGSAACSSPSIPPSRERDIRNGLRQLSRPDLRMLA